jgi:hypothetical protein
MRAFAADLDTSSVSARWIWVWRKRNFHSFASKVTRLREKVYEGMTPLTAEDIAEILVWVASRPAHVNIDELIVKPVDQAALDKVFRRARTKQD